MEAFSCSNPDCSAIDHRARRPSPPRPPREAEGIPGASVVFGGSSEEGPVDVTRRFNVDSGFNQTPPMELEVLFLWFYVVTTRVYINLAESCPLLDSTF